MGVLFIVAGVVAVLSLAVLAVDPGALPWLVVSSTVTTLAGYRVWRSANPTTDLSQELARRGRAVLAFVVGVSFVVVAMAVPQLVAIVVGIWVVVIVLLFVALAWAGRKGSG